VLGLIKSSLFLPAEGVEVALGDPTSCTSGICMWWPAGGASAGAVDPGSKFNLALGFLK